MKIAVANRKAGEDAMVERNYRRIGLGVCLSSSRFMLLGLWLYIKQTRELTPTSRAAYYSVRSACIGSSRDARHAGRAHATTATNVSTSVTSANTLQSTGLVP